MESWPSRIRNDDIQGLLCLELHRKPFDKGPRRQRCDKVRRSDELDEARHAGADHLSIDDLQAACTGLLPGFTKSDIRRLIYGVANLLILALPRERREFNKIKRVANSPMQNRRIDTPHLFRLLANSMRAEPIENETQPASVRTDGDGAFLGVQ